MMALASCENVATPETPAGKPETYTVQLACAGELAVNHVPLKSSSDDLYGIQVYYAPVSGGLYKHYAYGLFDDVSDVSLELIADYKYEFVVDMIVNGKNVIYSSNMNELEDEEIVLGYGSPFETKSNSSKNLTPITNEMIICDTYFSDLGGGCQLQDAKTYTDPKDVDVYYGKLTDYVPSEEEATISINMKRMIYGVKVIAGNFLTQGEVQGSIQGYHGGSYKDNFILTPPNAKVYEATYAYSGRGNWYTDVQNSATYECYVDFTWVKDDNTTLNLDRQKIKIVRMKQTVVNVTFYEDESAGNTKVSMVFDDLEMSENETTYTFGDDQEEYVW